MSARNSTKTSKGKIQDLQPKSDPNAGAHGGGGGAGKVSLQDVHFVSK